MKANTYEVGQRIKNIRKSKGLTMVEFGELIQNVGKSAIANWEKGQNLPNNERLKRIAEIGNVSINELLYGNYEDRIKNILLEKITENEKNSKYIDFTINYFNNKNDKYPSEQEVMDQYNEIVNMMNDIIEKKVAEKLLAINLRLAEDLLLNLFADISEDDKKEYVTQAMDKLAEATGNYETLFYKTTDEVYNEYAKENKE